MYAIKIKTDRYVASFSTIRKRRFTDNLCNYWTNVNLAYVKRVAVKRVAVKRVAVKRVAVKRVAVKRVAKEYAGLLGEVTIVGLDDSSEIVVQPR